MSYFNIVAQSSESTVVTEYKPQPKRSDAYQSKDEIVIPARAIFVRKFFGSGYMNCVIWRVKIYKGFRYCRNLKYFTLGFASLMNVYVMVY